jgi:hypothetical protein
MDGSSTKLCNFAMLAYDIAPRSISLAMLITLAKLRMTPGGNLKVLAQLLVS